MAQKPSDYTYNKQHSFREPEPENDHDPDFVGDWACDTCTLPIFSTPGNRSMHDECANLPATLAPLLHPGRSLVLNRNNYWMDTRKKCNRCGWTCEGALYECQGVNGCGFTLDPVCAVSVKVMHRSHEHKLTAVRGSFSSNWCSACGSQHGGRAVGLLDQFYVCVDCDFWLHPDCAKLPNAVSGGALHGHPLLLFYVKGWSERDKFQCSICSGVKKEEEEEKKVDFKGFGFYTCFRCDYYAHVKCFKAKSPNGLMRVLVYYEGVIPDSIRLPIMKDDCVSVTPLLVKALDIKNVDRVASTSIDSDRGGLTTDLATYDHKRVLDKHVLILHDDYQSGVERVCNACVQPISPSDSFYSCVDHNETSSRNDGPCKDYFLHSCCAYLPAILNFPRKRQKTLTLLTCKAGGEKTPFNLFKCDGCNYTCNGFAYLSQADDDTSLVLDIVCALMPTSIMHRSHGEYHILQSKTYNQQPCSYCGLELKPDTSYVCNNCRNFGIHPACALIPNQVRYRKFDPHPLYHWCFLEKEQSILCEVCENSIQSGEWHYRCHKCQQSLHFNCIPSVDRLSKIKFGFTVRVQGHPCPVACVRALSVYCYMCGHCGKTIKEHNDDIAFECPKCYFRIHKDCCAKTLLSDKVEWEGEE